MDRLTFWAQRLLVGILIAVFVAFYPMLISIYVFLPLFIGVMGYIFILGVDRGKISYILVSFLYLFNIDLNLSLPFFLVSIAIVSVYLFFYPYVKHFRKCTPCSALLTVLMIDVVYLGILLAYDFVFQTESVVLDDILLYPLIVDLIVAVML